MVVRVHVRVSKILIRTHRTVETGRIQRLPASHNGSHAHPSVSYRRRRRRRRRDGAASSSRWRRSRRALCPNSHAVLSDRSSGSNSVAITRRMLLLLVLLVLLRLWLLSTAVCRSQRRILGVQSLRGRVVLLLLLLMLLLMMMLLICSHTITLEIGSELIDLLKGLGYQCSRRGCIRAATRAAARSIRRRRAERRRRGERRPQLAGEALRSLNTSVWRHAEIVLRSTTTTAAAAGRLPIRRRWPLLMVVDSVLLLLMLILRHRHFWRWCVAGLGDTLLAWSSLQRWFRRDKRVRIDATVIRIVSCGA